MVGRYSGRGGVSSGWTASRLGQLRQRSEEPIRRILLGMRLGLPPGKGLTLGSTASIRKLFGPTLSKSRSGTGENFGARTIVMNSTKKGTSRPTKFGQVTTLIPSSRNKALLP